ncbi:MAG: MBL fold metallo-hydrolase [Syntrophaceae bacterium]|nr:MBL fold metallo-hydrolase [Syntrophaceae bacterium]
MRRAAEGKLNDRIFITGHTVYPGYIVKGSKRSVMIEAGLNILGPSYLRQASEFLGSPDSLDSLFVTHGHYEHMGALPFLKRSIPGLELRAHESTGRLLENEKTLKVMNFLSDQTAQYFDDIEVKDEGVEETRIGPVEFADPLREGDAVDLGDCTCEVFSTPGHTRDHLSYFLREQGILFPGEALGNPIMEREDLNKVEFLTSFPDYVSSIEKLRSLGSSVKVIAMSHLYYYTDDDVPRFMDMALRDAHAYRDLIDSYLDMENGDIERAAATMARVEYDEKKSVYQERNAYVTNLTAQVKAVAAMRERIDN